MSGYYWLASYPKSGNTWLRLFLESLAAGGRAVDINALTLGEHAASRVVFDWVLDIESADLTDDEIGNARPRLYEIKAQDAPAPLLSKVHDAWCMTPAGEPMFPPAVTRGAIYIVRDPRDVAVSLAHHLNESVDAAIAHMARFGAGLAAPRQRVPPQLPQQIWSWSRHVESWLDAPISVLPLRYEDMLADPLPCFGVAARFLGFEAARDAVAAAVDAVRFERLRAAEDTSGFCEAPAGAARFFRRGIAGGWQDSLTPEQVVRIERDHGAVMRRLGYL